MIKSNEGTWLTDFLNLRSKFLIRGYHFSIVHKSGVSYLVNVVVGRRETSSVNRCKLVEVWWVEGRMINCFKGWLFNAGNNFFANSCFFECYKFKFSITSMTFLISRRNNRLFIILYINFHESFLLSP